MATRRKGSRYPDELRQRAVRMVFEYDRSVRAFFRAIRRAPGFWLQMGATLSFGTSLFLKSGLETVIHALLLVGATLPVGYLLFRRSGRLP